MIVKRRQSNQLGRRVLCQLALSVALLLGASAAAFGQTETVNVTSATNSEIVVVTLVPVEGGGFTRDGKPFTGARVTLEGGFEYVVSQATDGTWMAQYQPKNVSFLLGDLGGMLTLVANEDGTFSDANGNPVVSGQNWQAGGNTYRLTLGEDGTWAGTYVQPLPQSVSLGTQGTVAVTRAEDGSWWIGETALMSGDTYSMGTNASGGANMYRLTLEDGEWSAVYAPAALDIAGTNLQATPDEDGEGYTVEGASLPKSGTGDITVTFEGVDELYHVWATDDGLAGARFDYPIRSNTVWEVDVKGDVAKPSLSTDDRKTPGSELRTMVKLAGEDFSVGELLGTGSDTAMPKTVLEGVRTEIAKLRNQVSALVDLYNDEALTRDAFDSQISDGPGGTDKWDRADTEIAKLFGGTAADGLLERETNPRRVVDAFDAILEALATEEAFVAATADGGGGVFEFAELAAGAAQRTYNATKWSASAVFDALGSTRFGAVKRQERNNAKAASFNANEDQFQVFAWSTTDLLRRSTDVQASGTAYYTGRTHAIDSEGTFYSGTMDLSVRFARRQVSGLVSGLTTADGARWEYGIGGEVAHIFLPDATMNASGGFSTSPAGNARVSYAQRAGALEAVELEDRAELTGRLLGRGDASGSEAVGTWRIYNVDQDPTPNPANASIMLAGAFGVQRGPDRPDPSQQVVDDLERTGAWSTRAALVAPAGHNTGLLSEEQYELDGSRFLPLLGVTARPAANVHTFPNAESFDTRAAARARIRELAGAGDPDQRRSGRGHRRRPVVHCGVDHVADRALDPRGPRVRPGGADEGSSRAHAVQQQRRCGYVRGVAALLERGQRLSRQPSHRPADLGLGSTGLRPRGVRAVPLRDRQGDAVRRGIRASVGRRRRAVVDARDPEPDARGAGADGDHAAARQAAQRDRAGRGGRQRHGPAVRQRPAPVDLHGDPRAADGGDLRRHGCQPRGVHARHLGERCRLVDDACRLSGQQRGGGAGRAAAGGHRQRDRSALERGSAERRLRGRRDLRGPQRAAQVRGQPVRRGDLDARRPDDGWPRPLPRPRAYAQRSGFGDASQPHLQQGPVTLAAGDGIHRFHAARGVARTEQRVCDGQDQQGLERRQRLLLSPLVARAIRVQPAGSSQVRVGRRPGLPGGHARDLHGQNHGGPAHAIPDGRRGAESGVERGRLDRRHGHDRRPKDRRDGANSQQHRADPPDLQPEPGIAARIGGLHSRSRWRLRGQSAGDIRRAVAAIRGGCPGLRRRLGGIRSTQCGGNRDA